MKMMRLEVPTYFFNILDFDDDEPAPKKCPKRAGKRNRCRQSAFQPSNLNRWFDAVAKQQEAQEDKNSDVFSHNFDVHAFQPSEISVKMDGDTLVVSGKHEHTSDDGEYELREYVRKVNVPKDVLVEQMKCKLDEKSGQLQIEAPLRKPEEDKPEERTIPIEFVKKPATEPEQQEMALD